MSEEPDEPVVTENEKYYDDVVAPTLLKLARDMEARGMGFIANVEYNPGDHGSTANVPALKSDAGHLSYLAIRAQGNIDAMAINWSKAIQQAKRDHGSIVLKLMGLEPEFAKRPIS